MTVLKAVLIMLAVLLASAALCWVCLWFEKKAPTEDYDERQQIAHGKAAGVSLWTGIVYFFVVIYWMKEDKLPAEGYLVVFAGLVLQLMVHHIYCLMTHSALPLSQKPWVTIGNYAILATVWILRATMYDPDWDRSLHGAGSGFWATVLGAFSFSSLAVMHLISLLWKEKE